MHIFESTLISNSSSAFSNFNPPRPTYGIASDFVVIIALSSTFVPTLSTRILSTKTLPAIIFDFAFSLDVNMPFSTSNTSSLFFISLPYLYVKLKNLYSINLVLF